MLKTGLYNACTLLLYNRQMAPEMDRISHILNGNNDKPTGMLWELNEIAYAEGLANQIGKNNILVFINSNVCQCLSKIRPCVSSMLSGEGITPMTDGHGGPSATAGTAASPCCHGNKVDWSAQTFSTSHLLQLEPRRTPSNFQLAA